MAISVELRFSDWPYRHPEMPREPHLSLIMVPPVFAPHEKRAAEETAYAIKLIERCGEAFAAVPKQVRLNGFARFTVSNAYNDALVALVDSALLCKARSMMVRAVPGALRRYQFNPHVTLCYVPKNSPQPSMHIEGYATVSHIVVLRTPCVEVGRFDVTERTA